MCSSASGFTWRVPERFPQAPRSTATSSWRRSTPLATSTPRLWQKYREHCGVRRFWNGADEEIGRLVHKPGGAEHAGWVFDYGSARADDDESGYRFASHTFVPGEYVSIRDHDNGELHTFRVMTVEPAT
jgi:hypothetical protein